MASFYERMAKVPERLLSPDRMGQGTIILSRTIPGAPPANPWDPPSDSAEQTELLRGAVRGVSKELVGVEVGGTIIVSSDRQAICAVPAMGYTAGDILSVDGKPVHIIQVMNIPAAGIRSAVKFIIRG